jgi:TfoX/Sxy family transcriptional regulator of competence genes
MINLKYSLLSFINQAKQSLTKIYMASNPKFVDFVIDQIDLPTHVSYRKMFGEYALYYGGKLFALICDDKLFLKPSKLGREFIEDIVEAPPYPGAKPLFLIGEKIEDRQWLKKLISITVLELPEPKAKKNCC